MRSYAFPGNIEPEILEIGAQQIPYMRTQEFSEINKESEKILNSLIDNPGGKTIIYTGSGTGAMDAVVANYVTTRRHTVVIDGGSFGHRWSQLCDYYNCRHTDVCPSFGHDVDYELLERAIIENNADTLLCQHHETSSGQLYNLEKISDICKRHNVSLIVDVISSFLVEDISMKDLKIDICITSSQKGLNIPPGISILFFAPSIVDYDFAHNSYYFDFQENLKNLTRGQTPFSPATTIFLQLHSRLKELERDGKEKYQKRARHAAQVFRGFCCNYGWNIIAENPSFAITGFKVNNNLDKIFRAMITRHDTFIMPGSIPGFFRVSHMGVASDDDLETLAKQIHEIETE